MRRPTHVAAAVAALALATAPVLLPATPALAATVFVETNPSTVQAGDEVGVRASCDDNLQPATVRSDAFGAVTVRPRYGFLTATVVVPVTTKAGDYRVRLTCPNKDEATSILHVVTRDRPTKGPAAGFGGAAGGGLSTVLIAGGLAAVAAGAGLGIVALRRRRAA
jgi:hypothetical protein